MSQPYEHKKLVDQAQVLSECDEIEAEIAALRATYEQYFLGIERKPPTDVHGALKKRLQRMRGMFVRQTAAKFRIQSVQQKFSTYERLWSRTIQEIENGTYIRDLRRAKRKEQKQAPAGQRPERDELSIEEVSPEEADALLSGKAFEQAPPPKPSPAAAPAVPPVAPGIAPVVPPVARAAPAVASVVPPAARAAPAPAAAPGGAPLITPAIAPPGSKPPAAKPATATASTAPTARPAAAPGQRGVTVPPASANPSANPSSPPPARANAALGDDKLRAVYDAYVKAKKRCNEDVGGMSYDQVASNLRKQVPELMKKHNAKAVEFKVVIKDGKAVLRAVPKE